jgi:hypothetical protein
MSMSGPVATESAQYLGWGDELGRPPKRCPRSGLARALPAVTENMRATLEAHDGRAAPREMIVEPEETSGLHREGRAFTAEERGEVVFGDSSSRVRVAVDPINGSLNTKRLIPSFALRIAVAGGGTMEDVELAYIYDFGTGRNGWRGGARERLSTAPRLVPRHPSQGLSWSAFEAARPAGSGPSPPDSRMTSSG